MGNLTASERPTPPRPLAYLLPKAIEASRDYIKLPGFPKGGNRRPVFVGERFGRWTALAAGRSERSRRYYRCVCDCGTEREVQATNLTTGISKSCGCWAQEIRGEGQRKPDNQSAITTIMRAYKRNAEERDLEWSLTRDDVDRLARMPCDYCGDPGGNSRERYPGFKYNGIDRVDNGKGYTVDNVVPCCGTCNRCKHTLSKDDFITWVARIAARHCFEGKK